MDQQLKQRLVGAAVIFSLAVIFLPMLLDGSGNRGRMLKNEIPSAPVIDSYALVEEKVIELKQEAQSLRQLEPLYVDEISDLSANEELPSPPEKAPQTELQAAPEEIPGKTEKSGVAETVSSRPAPAPTREVKTADPVPPPELKAPVPEKPAQKQAGGLSWVVQMGSFSDRSKAYELRDRLKKSGYSSVFIEKYRHDNGLNYRVRLGPFLTKKSATVVKNKVAAKYNLKGIEMHYEK